jgi:hypothetical protein
MGGLVGCAPACHGKLSGFEFRHPSTHKMGDISNEVSKTL